MFGDVTEQREYISSEKPGARRLEVRRRTSRDTACAGLKAAHHFRYAPYNGAIDPFIPHEEAARRLARQIEAASKSERFSVDAEAVGGLRQRGAAELHRVCAEFVSSVKKNLSEAEIELAPPAYSPETFREAGVNVMQISSQGRQVQITFSAGAQLVSTTKFRIPYVLEGEVRAYNQKMLERFEIVTLSVFYCVGEEVSGWRFYDWRTLHTGPVSQDFLVELMAALF